MKEMVGFVPHSSLPGFGNTKLSWKDSWTQQGFPLFQSSIRISQALDQDLKGSLELLDTAIANAFLCSMYMSEAITLW